MKSETTILILALTVLFGIIAITAVDTLTLTILQQSEAKGCNRSESLNILHSLCLYP